MAQLSTAVAHHIEEAQARVTAAMKQPLFPAAQTPPRLGENDTLPVKLGFEGNRVLLRAFMRFTGAILILCAPGLWLLPMSSLDPSLMLYKLGASIFFIFCGVALILRNKAFSQPEVYFDP